MITARYQSQSLADHLAGFMAANNIKDVPFEETSPIFIFLNELDSPLGRRQLSQAVKYMKKLTGLKHCFCLELIIKSFGYAHSTEAFSQMRGGFLTRKT